MKKTNLIYMCRDNWGHMGKPIGKCHKNKGAEIILNTTKIDLP